ncbi:putative major facilitator superfamily transporter [Zymoseptoria tritici IPO323]|uniref:Major facilitator superfamily transporter n=1 Tax=Zymoseptoria tritici (strain CBS 115943 / IPO323) TaxID=336722 RepID=F9X0P8_ZYMTI|nr:putative major facilitator superfamily transporter [Zymoseptoria tritici IPO323]EGP91919.1 putative major facilitator superfamily transporter [Zymoseptoria tritici IPO323]
MPDGSRKNVVLRRQQEDSTRAQSLDDGAATERTALLQPVRSGLERTGDANGKPIVDDDSSASTSSIEDGDGNNTAANQSLSPIRGACIVVALGALIFLQATNISMLTVIQSAIANELDAFERTSWFTSAYLIPLSALGPLNGKLSSVFSPRHCVFASALIMAIGALLSSFAVSFEGFVIGRVVTGIGASGVLPIAIIIVLEFSSSKRRGLAIGLLNSGYTVGVALGATAAGGLLPVVGWRALFWAQVPLAIVAGLGLFLSIPHAFSASDVKSEKSTWSRLRSLDYSGAITLTASLVLMLYALSAPKKIPILPIILSLIVAAIFVQNEVYFASDPIIPTTLLKSRGLLFTCLGTLGFMMARWSVLFYTPTYAIAVRQWPPSVAGSLLIPTNAGFAAGGLLVGWLHIKRSGSFYLPGVISYALFPVSLVVLAMLSRDDSPVALFIAMLVLCGFVTGAALNYTLAHLLHLTPKDTHYVASALLATFRGFAGSFGSAIGGGLFIRTLDTTLTARFAERGMQRDDLVRRLLGSPALVEQLEGVEREVAVQGYEESLKYLWLAMAGIAVLMVLVQAAVGWTGHAEKEMPSSSSESETLLGDDDSEQRS